MTDDKQSTGSLRSRNFRVTGMDCVEEVSVLKSEVGPVVGGEHHLSFDVLNAKMTVSADASSVDTEKILNAVSRTGMKGEPWSEKSEDEPKNFWSSWGRTLLTILSGVSLVLAVALHFYMADTLGTVLHGGVSAMPLSVRIVYVIAIVSGAWHVAPKAWFALQRLRPDMNLLMLIAVFGAVSIGELFEAATVAFLFALSLLLESWSVGRARRAVAALMDLAPPTVRLRQNGDGEIVSPKEVPVGSLFVVRPGERIPLDGKIETGASHVNQAPITGESRPVDKQAGDGVFAGTINGDGLLVIRSTKLAGATTLANIIRLVGEAHSRKAPSEQWVEKFARIYTPAVMLFALAVLFIPPVLFGQTWADWIYRSLVLLVIACPCALVISTPVSIVSGLASAARQGVLVKGGVFLEAPARLRAIAFDKTGTLTVGQPTVVEVEPLSGHNEQELLERAAALEAHSEHPLARAILQYAADNGITPTPVDEFQIIKGKGAQGRFQGRQFWIGSHRFLEERDQETPDLHRRLEALSEAGRSVVVLGNEEHVCGLFALADEIRATAVKTLQDLRSAGIEHLIMLSGDNTPTAIAIADRLGMDDVRAELLPEAKIAAIESLVEEYHFVAMVGDGVNDAPALARATVGIAMGAAGTDAAIETADIALMTDDLSRLPWLVHHSRRTLAIVRQNIGFSLAIKAVFVVLTFVGAASLWAAIAADMGASLIVIFNALRLLRE